MEEAGSEMEALEGRGWVGMAMEEREREGKDWEGSGDTVAREKVGAARGMTPESPPEPH